MERTREQIAELVRRFCDENRLKLSATVEGELAIEDLTSETTGVWTFFWIDPEGPQ